MKLVSCYIENYGKIKQKEYRFDGKVSVFLEENGAGKSTLASFIKSMFYGLESYRSNTKEFSERLHFYPFEGGAFGGNLVFEAGGKTYKIERFFGEKSDTEDTLLVYCNGEKTDEFGEEVGKGVFGIDKQSFERTAFISSAEIEIASTTGINAKLNNFLQGNDGERDLDEAKKALTAASKKYKKAKVGNDLITAENNKIISLKEKIANAEAVQVALEKKYADLASMKAEMAALEAKILTAQSHNEALSNRERYEEALEKVRVGKEQVRAIKEKYPFGLPTEDELIKTGERVALAGQYEAQLNRRSFTAADEAQFEKWSATFALGEPTDEQLAAVENAIENVSVLDTEIKIESRKERTDEQKRICQRFALCPPTEQQIAETESKLNAYKSAQRAYNEIPAQLAVTQQVQEEKGKQGKSGKSFLVTSILAALVCVLGGILLSVSTGLGVALLIGGGLTLGLSGFLYLNKQVAAGKTVATVVQQDNPEKRKMEETLRALADAVKAVLLPYGYASELGLEYDFASLKQDALAFRQLTEEEQKRAEYIQKMTESKAKQSERLAGFFRKYGWEGENYLSNLTALKSDLAGYASLKARRARSASDTEALETKAKENTAGITAFCIKYGMPTENLAQRLKTAENDLASLQRIEKEVAQHKAWAARFYEEKKLTDEPLGERLDLGELNAALSEKRSGASRLEREITADEYAVEALDGYVGEKEQSEAALAEYKQKHKLLEATVKLLDKAEQNLKDKYVKPVKDEFLYYAGVLEKALGEKVTMKRNFEIGFERNGKERSEKHFSSGQRSICALCFRLALIKNMYAGEKPFLVLDDPFVHLDSVHLQKVREVLQTLAQDMQIIYFSCHESRML